MKRFVCASCEKSFNSDCEEDRELLCDDCFNLFLESGALSGDFYAALKAVSFMGNAPTTEVIQ